MSKKQSYSDNRKDVIFFVSLFIIIIVFFLLLVPKVSSDLFPWKRKIVLNDFLNNVKQSNTIDPQKFWEFREFYSPGYITFNRISIPQSQIQSVESKIGVSINTKYIDRIFLTFTSPHLTSFEALTTTSKLSDIVDTVALNKKQTILSNSNEIIYKDAQNTHIIFLKPKSQMERANGFFNFNDTDKDIVKGKYWLEVTTLSD